jgi:hypothetical protein
MEFLQKDIVVFRDKTEGVVADDAIVRIDERGDWDWISLDDFKGNYMSKICIEWDIMEIKRKDSYEQCYTTIFKRGMPLEDGDIVVLKDGSRGVVVGKRIMFPDDGQYIGLESYNGYLNEGDEDLDISEHYRLIDEKMELLGKEE